MQNRFELNERVVHPKHGLGAIGATEEGEFGGQRGRYLIVEFEQVMLTLRIPVRKLPGSGLRRPCSREVMQAALAALSAARVVAPGHWTKRLAGLEEKLNSGEPKLLAELVRDLARREHGGSAARVYREALRRLAEELGLLEDLTVDGAREKIEASLAPESRVRKPPEPRRRGAGQRQPSDRA